jgi:hypothetical protein
VFFIEKKWFFARPHVKLCICLCVNGLTFSRPHVTPHLTPHVRPHVRPHVLAWKNIEKLDVLENVIFDILARIKKENGIE